MLTIISSRQLLLMAKGVRRSRIRIRVSDYFKGADILDEVSSMTLILLPKVLVARRLRDFRPVSLRNFSRKIISKILASRMAKLLPKIIDEEQAGFVQGSMINTHIVIAQELNRDLSRKVTGANVLLQL